MTLEELTKRARAAERNIVAGIALAIVLVALSPEEVWVKVALVSGVFVALYILPFVFYGSEIMVSEEGLVVVRLFKRQVARPIPWQSIQGYRVIPFPPPLALFLIRFHESPGGRTRRLVALEENAHFVREGRRFEGNLVQSIRARTKTPKTSPEEST